MCGWVFPQKTGALATLKSGGTVILPPSKDPEAIVEAIIEHQGTVYSRSLLTLTRSLLTLTRSLLRQLWKRSLNTRERYICMCIFFL